MASKWYLRPTSLEYLDYDYAMFVDENGHDNLKGCLKSIKKGKDVDIGERYFTLTGCTISKHQLKDTSEKINQVKYKYWLNGTYKYNNEIKRVCFHSREIRKKTSPFLFKSNDERLKFLEDISNLITGIDMTIFSANIDKLLHCINYNSPICPYKLSITFLTERYFYFLKKHNKKGVIILEGRGKKEDFDLLARFEDMLLIQGTRFIEARELSKYIKGVYFNNKWNNDGLTYFGLEISDLCSYPIHKYFRNNKEKNKSFLTFEDKIYNYPNYLGYGIKIFP